MHREYLKEYKPIQYNCLLLSRKLNLGDSESVLSLLYEAYGDINPMYDDQIKADFAELYQALNGTPLQEMDWIINPVCTLCRDHERAGFIHGVHGTGAGTRSNGTSVKTGGKRT